MKEVPVMTADVCPECLRHPTGWHEMAEHGSRELYWVGCRKHPIHLRGAVSMAVAIQNWNRGIARWKYDHAHRTAAR